MRKNPEKIPPERFIGKTIPQCQGYKIKEHIATGNNGHVFRAFNETIENNLAFKIIPSGNQSPNQLDEAKKANILNNESIVKYHHVVKHEFFGSRFIIFVCDYVEGVSLRAYIKKNKSNIDIPFIEKFLQTMFGLLFELDRRGYSHGDLHAGNILVARSEYDISGEHTFYVTDFGVGKLTGQTSHASDYLYVASILKELLECIQYQDCDGRDRYIYNKLQSDFLKRHLTETDPSADPLACDPLGLSNKLKDLETEWSEAKKPEAGKLQTPFDYPSCEQIGNSHLLLKNLYSDRLLGLSEIQAKSNLMLTGPRGCGKTTVFRALSLEYLISAGNDQPKNLDYIGIYYRCDDLYFSFPRYKKPERPEAFDIPMHYLIVTLLKIALEQIEAWSKRHFEAEFTNKEETFVAGLWDILSLTPPDSPSANHLTTLANKLSKERKRAMRKQQFYRVEPVKGYFGPGVLPEACDFIRKTFSFLRDRPFYCFIDDYSAPKITKPLQENLNRLVMQRNPDVFFKISTESPVSFARCDIDEKQFVETREFDLLNLGLRYIKAEADQVRKFLEDLFKRRFSEVENYPVETLEELLGSKPRNENETARAIRDGGQRAAPYYSGVQTIVAMCSGDIHYMISLVARMVDDNGGKENLENSNVTPRIPDREQNESIRAAAGAFMESIHILPETGPQLTEVITAFGNVAHSYLMYATSSNQGNSFPHQASRIEPYEPLNLSDEAKKRLDDLLRYSVLISDPRGKSRRGKVAPRFYLRRYLIPHFNLTFSKRDSLPLENDQIELLLCNPQRFEGAMKLSANDPRRWRNPDQKDIFTDE